MYKYVSHLYVSLQCTQILYICLNRKNDTKVVRPAGFPGEPLVWIHSKISTGLKRQFEWIKYTQLFFTCFFYTNLKIHFKRVFFFLKKLFVLTRFQSHCFIIMYVTMNFGINSVQPVGTLSIGPFDLNVPNSEFFLHILFSTRISEERIYHVKKQLGVLLFNYTAW